MLNSQVVTEKLREINHLLIENELKKLKTFYSNYFTSKSHFEEDGR